MKKQTKKKQRILWRSSFSKITGLCDAGFSEDQAVELKNMRPYAGGLRLRDGIMKGLTFTESPSFVGSANVSGRMTGFYSNESATYSLFDFDEYMFDGSNVCKPLSKNDFLFNLSGKTFLYRMLEREFYVMSGGEFEPAEKGNPTRAVRGNRAERDDVLLSTSLFDGLARIDFELTASTTVLDLGVKPAAISSVKCRGSAVGYSLDAKNLRLSESVPSGSTVSVIFRPHYMSANPSQPFLTGACSEDDSDVWLHTKNDIYHASFEDGKLCVSASALNVSGNIEKVFKCEDRTLAVVGTSVGEVDIKNGRIRFLKNGNVRSAKAVCPVGPCAYIYGNGRVERLSVSRSGSESELISVALSGRLFKQVVGETVSLAYSPRDRTLWLLYKPAYINGRIYVLDEDSGIWFEVDGGWEKTPTHLMPIGDGVAVVCEDGMYFSHPDFIQDICRGTRTTIKGEIVLCATVCSSPNEKKRLIRMGALLSGPNVDITLKAESDTGRSDTYNTSLYPSARSLSTALCRMDVGRSSALTLSAKVDGTSYSVLHELFAEISG